MAGLPLSARQGTPGAGVMPGFPLTLGITLGHLGWVVLLPLAVLLWRALAAPAETWLVVLQSDRTWAAFRVSLLASLGAAAVNVVLGSTVAWVLARYRFAGKAVMDALVDVPFALPTAVAGIALTAVVTGQTWLGAWLEQRDIHVAFTPWGVMLALVFVGLPFVVRTVQPVLLELDRHVEEAAATLGATPWQTFVHIILPLMLPSMVTGFALAFARGLGEYGSVVFISGNMPMRTEIVPLLMVTKLEQYDHEGATVLAVLMLGLSFGVLFLINRLQQRLAHAVGGPA